MKFHFPGAERYARCPGSPIDPDTALCSLSGSAPPPSLVSAHGVRLPKFRVGQEWFHGVGSVMGGINDSVIIASVFPHWVGNGAWEPFTGMALSVH